MTHSPFPLTLSFVPQAPKTPLQKSMDLLGKQLSLYSFGIIGGHSSHLVCLCHMHYTALIVCVSGCVILPILSASGTLLRPCVLS